MVVFISLGLLPLLGCAPKKALKRPSFIPSSHHLINTIHERNESIRSLKGIGKITYVNGDKKQHGKILVMGLKPTYLRFDVIGFWGNPTLSFITDGTQISLLSYSERRLYKGNIDSQGFCQIWPLALGIQNILSIISGNIPLIEYGREEVEYSLKEALYVIQLISKDGSKKQKIWLDVSNLNCVKGEVVDHKEGLLFRIEFAKFKKAGNLASPFLVKTYMPNERTQFSIKFKDLVLNSHITKEDFCLEVPEEIETVYVD
ncbi:MAG TPA: DUF4292 domain-containing protein [Syntrophaceae bacterium]|nr:DUF4292 domain-containing protein [Syntrophaceae bacterium]